MNLDVIIGLQLNLIKIYYIITSVKINLVFYKFPQFFPPHFPSFSLKIHFILLKIHFILLEIHFILLKNKYKIKYKII